MDSDALVRLILARVPELSAGDAALIAAALDVEGSFWSAVEALSARMDALERAAGFAHEAALDAFGERPELLQ
jgi:hypothetical protein